MPHLRPPRPRTGSRRPPALALLALLLVVVGGACMPPLVEPPTSGRSFGEGPLDAVYEAASAEAACGLTPIQLAALMMAPTYSEAGGPVPSPMALSRWDNLSVSSSNRNLFAFGQTSGPYVNAFFSPGIGMWQFDSAGAWPFSAAGAIDSVTSAQQAATTMAYRWCNAPSSQQSSPAARRKYAWGPWYGCSTTSTCESVYTSLVAGDRMDTAFDRSVERYGGMQQRRCNVAGLGDGLTCWHVDPARAQGSRGWTGGTYTGGPGGVTPLPKPFYVVEAGGREYRIWIRDDTGYDTGITASKPITANARTSLTWSATAGLCDVTTNRGQCAGRVAQTPWGPRSAEPIGWMDEVAGGAGRTATVVGWALDPDTEAPIDVHVYVDGAGAAVLRADQSRPDIGRAIPGYGDRHGFATTLRGLTPGVHQVCSYGINVGPTGAGNTLLGCAQVAVPGEPTGYLDGVRPVEGGLAVQGWALDPDTTGPTSVRVVVDGVVRATASADRSRPDLASAYPWAGDRHGYEVVVPTTGGPHTVCVTAINVGPTGAGDTSLGCAGTTVDGSPLGFFDRADPAPGSIMVSGWAFDPDTSDARVQVRVDGGPPAVLDTDRARADVGRAYPGRGDVHGYEGRVAATPGSHQVCVSAQNAGPVGADRPLGCRTVVVGTGAPFGVVDGAGRTGTGATASVLGWTIDPDVDAPIAVHVYVNGAPVAAVAADRDRPDIAAAFPGYGPRHGFELQVPVPAGPADVCVYAIDATQAGLNPLLGCRRV